jgi:hypothetical protein
MPASIVDAGLAGDGEGTDELGASGRAAAQQLAPAGFPFATTAASAVPML